MDWTRDEVLKAVTKVVAEHAETAEVYETTELVADLGIDSLGIMEMLADIEDEFGMTIADRDLLQVITLGDVVAAIAGRLKDEGRLSS